MTLIIIISLTLIAVVIALFLLAGYLGNRLLENGLLLVLCTIQIALVASAWGELNNVHGGFIALLIAILVGLAIIIGEFALFIFRPNRNRAKKLAAYVFINVLMFTVATQFGG